MLTYATEYEVPMPLVAANEKVFCERQGEQYIPKNWQGSGWPKSIPVVGKVGAATWLVTPELFRGVLFHGVATMTKRVPISYTILRLLRRQIHAGEIGRTPILKRIGRIHGQLARFWDRARKVGAESREAKRSRRLIVKTTLELMNFVSLATTDAQLQHVVEAGRSLFAWAAETCAG